MKPDVRPSKLRAFTLVEIVLALMVAAVGCIGVMALFPIGLSKNKETVATRSAADAADQFLHTMAGDIRADWDTVDAFPDMMSTMSEEGIVWSDATVLPDSNCTINFSAINASDDFDPAEHQHGIYKVIQKTPANFTDFTGVIRSWKELTEIGDPRLNGDVVPVGLVDNSSGSDTIAYGFEYGKEYILKDGGGDGDQGNYGPLALGGNGASIYESNWLNGYSDISVGDIVDTEPGNMAGPTVRGVEARLAATPYVQVPIVTEPGSGRSDVEVLAFLPFKLVDASSSGTGGNASAEVRVIYIGSDANSGDVETKAKSYKITLKAEVSWPHEISYELRKKSVYSLKLFKGGTLASFITPTTGNGSGSGSGDDEGGGGGDDDDDDDVVVVEEPDANIPPVASSDAYRCAHLETIMITVVATDADDDPLTYTHAVPSSFKGTLSATGVDNVFEYVAPRNGNFSTSFTFVASDGTDDSNTATIEISKN